MAYVVLGLAHPFPLAGNVPGSSGEISTTTTPSRLPAFAFEHSSGVGVQHPTCCMLDLLAGKKQQQQLTADPS